MTQARIHLFRRGNSYTRKLRVVGVCERCEMIEARIAKLPESDYREATALWRLVDECECAFTMSRAPRKSEAAAAFCGHCETFIEDRRRFWNLTQSAWLHDSGCEAVNKGARSKVTYWRAE